MKRSWSAFVGIVAGALTLGVATLLAGVMTRTGLSTGTPSPVIAVGGTFVDHTPPWLKDFAVSSFGTHDKLALFVGMALVLAALCAVIGVLGAGRHTAGLGVCVVVGAMVVVGGEVVVVGAGAALPTCNRMDVPGRTVSVGGMLWEMTRTSGGDQVARV